MKLWRTRSRGVPLASVPCWQRERQCGARAGARPVASGTDQHVVDGLALASSQERRRLRSQTDVEVASAGKPIGPRRPRSRCQQARQCWGYPRWMCRPLRSGNRGWSWDASWNSQRAVRAVRKRPRIPNRFRIRKLLALDFPAAPDPDIGVTSLVPQTRRNRPRAGVLKEARPWFPRSC